MNRREALLTFLALPATTVVTRTELRPYDLIVFSAPGAISVETANRIKAFAEANFPVDLNIKAIVLGDGLTVSIVRDGARK